MILKAKIKCICGCTYEMVSCKKHQEAKCPNCSRIFSESEKLIEILEIYNSIHLESQNNEVFSFSNEALLLNTLDCFSDDKSIYYEEDKAKYN